jgi:hypothetical protein
MNKTYSKAIVGELKNSKGRFTGIGTLDGRTFNAKVVRVTPHYVVFNDRNMGTDVKIALSSVSRVNNVFA